MSTPSPELVSLIVERFLAARCVTGDGLSTRASALYRGYLNWSAGSPNTIPAWHFSRALKARGFVSKRNSQGMLYLGLAPLGDLEPTEPSKPRPKRARVRPNDRLRIVPSLKRFIESECETGNTLKIRTCVAYARYKSWILANRDPQAAAKAALNKDYSLLAPETLTMPTFIGVMRELGFPKKRTRAYAEPGFARTQISEYVLVGLFLRPESSSETIPA